MKSLRPWATPLTVATTLITAFSGVLLFFHLAPGLTRPAHEWIGMLMVAAVLAHLVLNWRAFKSYLKRPLGLVVIVGGVVGTLASVAVSLPSDEEGGNPLFMAMQQVNQAPLEALPPIVGRDIEAILADLGAAGFEAEAGDSIATLAAGSRDRQAEAIRAVFAR